MRPQRVRAILFLAAGALFGAGAAAALLPSRRAPLDQACRVDDGLGAQFPLPLGADTAVGGRFAGDTLVITLRRAGTESEERWLTDPRTGAVRDAAGGGRVVLSESEAHRLEWPATLARLRRCAP